MANPSPDEGVRAGEWLTTAPNPNSIPFGFNGGQRGGKLHYVQGERAACGITARDGWGLDLHIETRCARCEAALAALSTPVPEEGLPRGTASAAEGKGLERLTAKLRVMRAEGDDTGWMEPAIDWLQEEAAELAAQAGDGVAAALPSPLPSQAEPVADLIAALQAACETAWANSSAIGLFKAAAEALAAERARADRAEEDERDRLYAKAEGWMAPGFLNWLRDEDAMLPADRAALRARTILKETPHDER